MPDGTKRFSFIEPIDGMGGIFNNKQIACGCYFHYPVHITGHSGIMHHNDRPGPRCDEALDPGRINIRNILLTVGKNKFRPAQ